MARQIINTGTVPNDGTGDPLRTALTKTNENFEEIYPITETVTKTVAADGDPAGVQDFDSFHEAMTWACGQFVQGTYLILLLEDGTHYVGPPESIDPSFLTYYIVTNANHIQVKGASGDQTLCFITMPVSADVGYKSIFSSRNSYLYVEDLTIDLSLSGYLYASKISPLSSTYGGLINTTQVTIKNCSIALSASYNSFIFATYCTVDSCGTGLQTVHDSVIDFSYGEIKNCSTGIQPFRIGIVRITNYTFSGNTADSSITLNTIQKDGSYITDETVPLIQADSVGTTAERPTARQIGHAYFDTTLGYSINWDGTNWVDSTGTTV